MTEMRQSYLFTKTRREAPKDEVATNAQLLVRAGYIHKEMAGVYTYLPLGLRVLGKIEKIIREEMVRAGGQEVLMTALQDPSVWKQSGRWSDEVVDNWFKTALKDGGELGLGHSHEEPLVRAMQGHVSSYRDLPRAVFQIQNKFRNELRAKSGILRGREFIMKDMYSFCRTQDELDHYHEHIAGVYKTIFERVGIGERTFRTKAAGGSFSKYSDEFQMLCAAGEDTIYVDRQKGEAINKEIAAEFDVSALEEQKAIEVGNIFKLGTRFSEPLGLTYKDEQGTEQPVLMGCYGIGLGRLMGSVAEALSDSKGLVWPEAVAPYKVHLVRLGEHDDVVREADEIYNALTQAGVEVLYDDRDLRAGEKFADSDLIGIPWRVVVSEKAVGAGAFEVVERASGATESLSQPALIQKFSNA